jgi:3-dehydroquinate dehydratase-2
VKVIVLNGPNLGRLGTREPDVYGHTTYPDLVKLCEDTGNRLGLEVEVRQTDAEHEMIGWLHEASDAGAAVVLNPGAWSHYSYAIRDACSQLRASLVEVHFEHPRPRGFAITPLCQPSRWRDLRQA